jgi:16S rRNA (uracil1498-N3)-methyltransferase
MDLFLVGSLAPDARLLRIVLEERRRKKPRNVALLIGPEGDLTPDELEEARRTGAVPVSFGSLVLRVETAALFGMSVLASEFLAGTR